MKLKLIVASMSVLGLISCPTAVLAKKHHHKPKQQQTAQQQDYKDMGSYKDMQEVCTISQSSIIMDEMTQNMGRAMPNPCNPGWFNRVQFSGGINVDVGKWGNRNANIMGENYQRISLNDAYLNVSATVNDWAKAFASLSYSTPTTNADQATYKGFGIAEYSAAYANNVLGGATNLVQVEQAYATLGNFDVSPFFVQVGKQFQDFGRYQIHPITRSLTQVMSETLATSLKAGFLMPMGLHGSVYVFDDPMNQAGSSSTSTNFGLALGYDQPSDQLGWDVGAAYLYNMMGVNDIAYQVANFTQQNGYNKRVGGYALYGDVNSGPFMIGARFVGTAGFNPGDLPQDGIAGVNGGQLITRTVSGPLTTQGGAKPWAAGVQAGYGFDAWGKNQNIYVGYQGSSQAAGLDLPRSRWLAGYNVDVWKSTMLGIEWDHDNAYSASDGGSGNTTNLVSLRAGVNFN